MSTMNQKTYFGVPKPKKSKRQLRTIGLFSGSGGMDLGFKQEGYEIIWANDNNHWACETYKRNFGDHIVESEIQNIPIESIPDCDIILGGFPCQDFSMIWKRQGLATERGNLFRYFANIVKAKQPKIFVAENVKGLLSANNKLAIKTITDEFASAGYDVSVNPINFANYGAPQFRERVLIIGIRKDLGHIFTMPEPTNGPGTYFTSGQALEGVENVPYNNEHQNIMPKTIEMLKLIPPGGNFTSIPKDSPLYVKGMISHVYRRLDPKKPSTTIIAGGGGGTWGYHHLHPRPLTNRERARLFGYPDDFIFEGTITEVRRQIGNSVPPIGVRPIARKLLELL